MGIGLYICKALIDLVGVLNSIKIESKPNCGTCISFNIFKDIKEKKNI